jgi:hypothetical protein
MRKDAVAWIVTFIITVAMPFVGASLIRINPAYGWPLEGILVLFSIGLLLWAYGKHDATTWRGKVVPVLIMFVGVLTYAFGAIWYYRAHSLNEASPTPLTFPSASEIAGEVANRIQPKPEVDFALVPEPKVPPTAISYIPSLTLTVRNRGGSYVEEIRLIATEYQFAYHTIEESKATRLPDGGVLISDGRSEFIKVWSLRAAEPSLVIKSVPTRSSSQPQNLSILPPFKFVKLSPGKPAPASTAGQPLGDNDNSLRFYALRFSFIDASTQKRYARYRIISCTQPYLLPNDNPDIAVGVGGGDLFHGGIKMPEIIGEQTHDAIATWTAPGHENPFTAIPKKILEDQKAMYADSPEEEPQ